MRRSRDETKDLLLGAALDQLYEKGLFVAVTHIRLTEVVKAAGFTTGAAYKVWERQEDFHRDLAVEAIRFRERLAIAQTVQLIHKAVDGGAPLREILRLGSPAHLHPPEAGDPFLIALALRTLSPSVPEIAEASRGRHEESVEAFEQLYEAMLLRFRLRIRAPFALRDLSNALAAITEGFALQTLCDLDHPTFDIDDESGVGAEWSLLAVTVDAIVTRFTEPIPEGDGEDPGGRAPDATAATGFRASEGHP